MGCECSRPSCTGTQCGLRTFRLEQILPLPRISHDSTSQRMRAMGRVQGAGRALRVAGKMLSLQHYRSWCTMKSSVGKYTRCRIIIATGIRYQTFSFVIHDFNASGGVCTAETQLPLKTSRWICNRICRIILDHRVYSVHCSVRCKSGRKHLMVPSDAHTLVEMGEDESNTPILIEIYVPRV